MTFTTVTYWRGDTECTVPAQPTGNPHLFLAPFLDAFGEVCDGWYLLHQPTGRACGITTLSCDQLRRIAGVLARNGLDYSSPQLERYNSDDTYRDAYRAALREVEGVEPSPEVAPTTRESGIPRQALPFIAGRLEHYDKSGTAVSKSRRDTRDPERQLLLECMANAYATAYLLAALHRCDPDMADQVAASLADDWESDDTMAETVYGWRRELTAGKPLTLRGVPTPMPDELLSEVPR